jgi:RNA polymerase sigma factor (sigma-70 family)
MPQDDYDWLSKLEDVEQHRRLREKLITYFARRDRSDAEDLADETILRGWKQLATGTKLTAPLDHFMFGIARNVLRERINKDRHLDQLGDQTPTPPSSSNPFADLLQKEIDQCVEQCLQTLKPEEREIYNGFYEERATIAERDSKRAELAGKFNLSHNGLRNRVFWIRKRIIECARLCLDKKSVKQIPR